MNLLRRLHRRIWIALDPGIVATLRDSVEQLEAGWNEALDDALRWRERADALDRRLAVVEGDCGALEAEKRGWIDTARRSALAVMRAALARTARSPQGRTETLDRLRIEMARAGWTLDPEPAETAPVDVPDGQSLAWWQGRAVGLQRESTQLRELLLTAGVPAPDGLRRAVQMLVDEVMAHRAELQAKSCCEEVRDGR